MNCKTVTDQLLDGATHRIPELAPHLDLCQGCSALATRVIESEAELGRELDAFMTARPPDYGRLPIPPRRTRTSAHGLLLGLAIAAVVVLAALPSLESTDPVDLRAYGDVPERVLTGDAAFASFESIDLNSVDLAGLTRREQDLALSQLLRSKSQAFRETEQAYIEALETVDPEWRVEIHLTLGDLYEQMADGLVHMVRPSYLTDEQDEIYRMALEDKAQGPRRMAREAFELALEEAEEIGSEAQAEVAYARVERLEQIATAQQAEAEALQREIELQEAEDAARGQAIEVAMHTRRVALADLLAACASALDEEALEEAAQFMAQVDRVIEAEELALYPEVHDHLGTYLSELRARCEGRYPL